MYNPSEEFTLIKFLLNKENYSKYFRYINSLNLEQETKTLVKAIDSYYKLYDTVNNITVDDLLLYINTKLPTIKQGDIFNNIIDKLRNTNINSELIKENFNNILEYYFGSELIYNISSRIEDRDYGFLDEAYKTIESFKELKLKLVNKDSKFVQDNLSELIKIKIQQPGLKWRIGCLNYHLGELRGKSLGHVFARVDTGKTSFILSEEANWVKQLSKDEYIVHFNNEEDGAKVKLRFAQSLLECSKEYLEANPEKAEAQFKKYGGDRLLLYDSAIISIDDIESILQEYNVRIIVIDQADKIHFKGDKNLNDVGRLQSVYARLRDLAKKYGCDILTVGQASQSAENKKWLTPLDLDGSKTLKPGEFDYIIGIGKVLTESEVSDKFRYIHLCKNKMGTGQHARQEVIIDTTRALYFDISSYIQQGGERDDRKKYQGSKGGFRETRNFGSD